MRRLVIGNTEEQAIRRRMLRVLRMVGELHLRGYQRLRIVPGMAPSGMHWRCCVLPASLIDPEHGALPAREEHFDLGARYTTGQDNRYFDWKDAKAATAPQLADRFVQRFPELARDGWGDDWAYAGWYQTVLRLAALGAFPCAYDDSPPSVDDGYLPTVGYVGEEPLPRLRLPPPPPATSL